MLWSPVPVYFTVPQPQAKTRCTSTGNILGGTTVLSVSSTSSGSLMSGIDILLGTSNWGIRSGHVQDLLESPTWSSAPAWWDSQHENSAYFHTPSCSLRSHEDKLKGRARPKTDWPFASGLLGRTLEQDFGAYYEPICMTSGEDLRAVHPLSPLAILCPFLIPLQLTMVSSRNLSCFTKWCKNWKAWLLLLSLLHRKSCQYVILSILEILKWKWRLFPKVPVISTAAFNKP